MKSNEFFFVKRAFNIFAKAVIVSNGKKCLVSCHRLECLEKKVFNSLSLSTVQVLVEITLERCQSLNCLLVASSITNLSP